MASRLSFSKLPELNRKNMSELSNRSTRLPNSRDSSEWIGLVSAIIIVVSWVVFGTRFYDSAVPFYDSLSYQEGYRTTISAGEEAGIVDRIQTVWLEGSNNLVLYKFFAALFGGIFPSPKLGLFTFLFSVHLAASFALFRSVREQTTQGAWGLVAVSIWWSTTPFGLLRDGVGDQRMDLATGSFCLLVCALGMSWIHRPRLSTAAWTGLGTALMLLHRPIMAAALTGIGVVIAVTAIMKHKSVRPNWVMHFMTALAPVLLLALPWMVFHFESLRSYYLDFNVDVGSTDSYWDATVFNSKRFEYAFGAVAGILWVFAMGFGWKRNGLDPSKLKTVLLLFLSPLAVLIVTKSVGNLYVAQMALGLPILSLAAIRSDPEAVFNSRWSLGAAAMLILVVALVSPFRLSNSLDQEHMGLRLEVENVVHNIDTLQLTGLVGGFHDQPANVVAIAAIARDLNIDISAGSHSYHPLNFGLSIEEASNRNSSVVHQAVADTVQRFKHSNDFVLLPTKETEFLLWQGLFSHQMIPNIRECILADPEFKYLKTTDGITGIHFDVFKCPERLPN